MSYEYKVVPAPTRGLKAKGVKSVEDRFANALQATMNELGADGWEYLRADTLPCEQREGLLSKTTVYQNMLVFRRVMAAETVVVPPSVDVTPPEPPVVAPPSPVKTGIEREQEEHKIDETSDEDTKPQLAKESDVAAE